MYRRRRAGSDLTLRLRESHDSVQCFVHDPSDSLTNDQPEQDQQLVMRLRTKCSGGFRPIQIAGTRKTPQRHVACMHAKSRHHRDPTRPRQIVDTTSVRCTRSAERQTTADNHPTDVPFRRSPSLMAATRWNRQVGRCLETKHGSWIRFWLLGTKLPRPTPPNKRFQSARGFALQPGQGSAAGMSGLSWRSD